MNEIITAFNVLEAANNHMSQRASTYDSQGGERSMNATVEAFNTITGHKLLESEGWLFMALLKAVRANQRESYHGDSFEDMAAYVALSAEAKAKESTRELPPLPKEWIKKFDDNFAQYKKEKGL